MRWPSSKRQPALHAMVVLVHLPVGLRDRKRLSGVRIPGSDVIEGRPTQHRSLRIGGETYVQKKSSIQRSVHVPVCKVGAQCSAWQTHPRRPPHVCHAVTLRPKLPPWWWACLTCTAAFVWIVSGARCVVTARIVSPFCGRCFPKAHHVSLQKSLCLHLPVRQAFFERVKVALSGCPRECSRRTCQLVNPNRPVTRAHRDGITMRFGRGINFCLRVSIQICGEP